MESHVNLSTIGSLTNPRGGKGEFSHIPFGSENSSELSPETFRRFSADLGLDASVTDRICEGTGGYNVGRMTKWVEDYSAVHVSMGFCNHMIIMRHLDLDTLSALYRAATGLEVSPSQLLTSGERIFNVLKAFNILAGATRRDDLPSRGATWDPDRPMLISGQNYGTLNDVLNQYYDERGWNQETGIPTRNKLAELGLQDVADDLDSFK